MEYYIGQIFDEMYPSEAATWCDNNRAVIVEIKPVNNVRRFEIQAQPEPTPPTYEEIDRMRIIYRREHIDDRTIARMRKQANGTWTEEEEQEYLALDAEVTAYIEENLPYPETKE